MAPRFRRMLLPIAMRYAIVRRAIGIHTIYRETGGGLISAGLAYSALFALIPAIVLIIGGLYLLIDDPQLRADAISVIDDAFPALRGVAGPAVASAADVAAVGSIIAVIGFGWAASGLYLQLTRAMERFFPGERVSGVLARLVGIVLVLLVIIGVLTGMLVAGVLTVVLQALALDTELLLGFAGAASTLVIATALAYAIYRVMPAAPPSPHGARLPAILVGGAIGLMTLFYGLIAPWLVSGFQAFGVMASVFVALVWLRVVFLAMVYGAAMARYRDHVAIVAGEGAAEPDAVATQELIDEVTARASEGTRAAAAADRATEGDPGTDARGPAEPGSPGQP